MDELNNNSTVKCEICGKEFEHLRRLSAHIWQIHKLKIEDYYLKHIGIKGVCKICGKDTKFYSLSVGYNKFCSPKCSNIHPEIKQKCIDTFIKKYGCKSSNQCEKVKNRKKETCLKNWNCENPFQNKEIRNRQYETVLRNNNGIHPSKLTYKKCKEKYPDLVKIEGLKEGPNGEIMGHCKNSSCKNSKENGGYFEVTPHQINMRNIGINSNDTGHFYCCEECKHSCPLYGKSATALHNRINENPEIPYTSAEYNTWKEEVYHRQRIENDTDTNFCEYCHATENLHVHHEVPQKIVPGYALDPINGIIFCEDCHYKYGHEKGTDCSTGNLANKICK